MDKEEMDAMIGCAEPTRSEQSLENIEMTLIEIKQINERIYNAIEVIKYILILTAFFIIVSFIAHHI